MKLLGKNNDMIFSFPKIFNFEFGGAELTGQLNGEILEVIPGVYCQAYKLGVDDEQIDLAIVSVAPCSHTPFQLVLKGDLTREIYLSGEGHLVISKPNSVILTTYSYGIDWNTHSDIVDVRIGERMQWCNHSITDYLIFAELCAGPAWGSDRFIDQGLDLI